MTARSESVAATRQRILDAVETVVNRSLDFEPTLEAVAGAAGVSVPTVLRHFGSRDGLLDAAVASVQARVVAERTPPTPDLDAALVVLVEHYELRGDVVLAMLGREQSDRRIAGVTEAGKRLHREWVTQLFAARLPLPGPDRDALIDLLVVATDVYAWKLLRRDRGHSPAVVRDRMRSLIDAILT